MSFFGFDTALPDDPRAAARQSGRPAGQQAFFGAQHDPFGALDNAGEREDLAVYTWGEDQPEYGTDMVNDETFGDEIGEIGQSSAGT
jgi:hypothetical protein